MDSIETERAWHNYNFYDRDVLIDNITIERIWQDNDFFEIKVMGSSDVITAHTRTYTTDEGIDGLASIIEGFINGLTECLWENGSKNTPGMGYVSFEFIRKDELGHIQLKVYMGLFDGRINGNNYCCFILETELGLLESFSKNLEIIKKRQIGNKITLNPVVTEA